MATVREIVRWKTTLLIIYVLPSNLLCYDTLRFFQAQSCTTIVFPQNTPAFFELHVLMFGYHPSDSTDTSHICELDDGRNANKITTLYITIYIQDIIHLSN